MKLGAVGQILLGGREALITALLWDSRTSDLQLQHWT